MATLHLMVGLPGSGKTTLAKRLEVEHRALRLTPDEWQLHLFGNDFHNDPALDAAHNERHTKIEELMWQTADKLLRLGVDVILDFGCWAREERDAFREKAHAAGADFRIHYTACSIEALWARLEERNRANSATGSFVISRESILAWADSFEPPTEDELARH